MIGNRLRDMREDNDETQQGLADYLGVSLSTIRNWEKDRNEPDYGYLVEICKHYHVSSDYLLGLSDEDLGFELRHRQATLRPDEQAEVRAYTKYLIWKRTHQTKK